MATTFLTIANLIDLLDVRAPNDASSASLEKRVGEVLDERDKFQNQVIQLHRLLFRNPDGPKPVIIFAQMEQRIRQLLALEAVR